MKCIYNKIMSFNCKSFFLISNLCDLACLYTIYKITQNIFIKRNDN